MSLRDPLWGKREKSSGTERRFELLEVVPSAKSQHWFQAEGERRRDSTIPISESHGWRVPIIR